MEKAKISKKALTALINESLLTALSTVELPGPSKKVKKLLQKSAKKIASIAAHKIKRESKKKEAVEKSLTYVEEVLKGKKVSKKNGAKKTSAEVK